MKIGIAPQHGEVLLDDELFEFDGTYNPLEPYGSDRIAFKTLKEYIESTGDEIATIDRMDPNDLDVVVFVDTNFDRIDRILDTQHPPYLVYLMREPPTFIADNDPSKFTELAPLFDLVFTWNDDLIEQGEQYVNYCIPQYPERRWGDQSYSERDLLVNVTARKYSTHPDELYTEREQVISYFDDNHPDQFTLYGKGWNRPPTLKEITLYRKPFPKKYQSFDGLIDDKIASYHNFRFALCFENVANIRGYVTEKIFDCFRGGVVPVYWGASNISEYIPDDLFIDYRQFNSPTDLYDHLEAVTEDEFEAYLDRIASFLDEGLDEFKPEAYAKTIHNGLQQLPEIDRQTLDAETREMVRQRAKVERITKYHDSIPRHKRLKMLGSAIRKRPRVVREHPRSLYYTVR